MVVLIVGILYVSMVYVVRDFDSKTYVMIGSCFNACTGAKECPASGKGYDGQFAYYIAQKQFDAAACLDVPAYRMQRILLPMLGYGLSLGQRALIPWAFVVINLFSLVVSTVLLEDLLIRENQSRWFALSYGLFAGAVAPVRFSTNEALAYAFVIASLWFYARKQLWWMVLMLAFAAFAKETTGIFTAGYLLYFARNRRWSDAWRVAIGVGLPFMVWQLVLYRQLGAFGLGSGGAYATSFEIIPFKGLVTLGRGYSLAEFIVLGILLSFPFVVVPSVWGLVRSIVDFTRHKSHLYSNLLFVCAAIMPFVPYSTYRDFIALLRFIPGLVIAITLYTAHYNIRRPLVYSTFFTVMTPFLLLLC